MSDQAVIAFARDVLAFPLRPRQGEILAEIYGAGIRTAVLRLGRRSGKGRTAAVLATFEATANAAAHLAAVPADERVYIVVISRSTRQAQTVHGYIRSFLRRPLLAGMVRRETTTEIELTNGIVIRVLPCHAASVRGDAIAIAILDELAFWTGVDGSPLDPKEIVDAVSPATAQFPAGRVVILSTPRYASGYFAELCERADSGSVPDLRHWHATTAEMMVGAECMPGYISPAFLESKRAEDPDMFAREYEAAFAGGVGSVFAPALIRAAVRREPAVLSPLPGRTYLITADPAYVGDVFAAAVSHRDGRRIVVDRVLGWTGTRANPVQIDPTLDEIAALSVAYNRAPVVIDQYSAQPILQGLRVRGIAVLERPWSNEAKVDAVAAVRRALYAEQLEIPDHAALISELASLEQRPTPSGRPRIAAPGQSHDDYATCVMAACLRLGRQRGVRVLDQDEDGRIVMRIQYDDIAEPA